MKNSDVYIQSSVQEGFGNAVLEAQASGLCCIVSDAEGLSENVLNEKTGLGCAQKGCQITGERYYRSMCNGF